MLEWNGTCQNTKKKSYFIKLLKLIQGTDIGIYKGLKYGHFLDETKIKMRKLYGTDVDVTKINFFLL